MTRKNLRLAIIAASALLLALTAGVVFASTTKTQSAGLPEYLGDQACLGCHVEKFLDWETSLHANYVKEIKTVADLPGDPEGIAPELQDELAKAKYYFHDRFLSPDLKTGELIYLGIEYDEDTKEYVAAPNRKGRSFDASCGGCHAGADYQSGFRASIGVGCESCHGPGRDHILGKGDPSKISSSADPTQNCIACHSGYNQMPDSTRYPIGYRPAMDLASIGFMGVTVDPTAPPQRMHHKGAVPQWQASGHANATNLLAARGEKYLNRQECIYCHSTSAGLQIADGKEYVASRDFVNDGVTCVACHDPHGSSEPGQLKMNAQELCLSCHSVGRGEEVAPKIYTKRAPHSPQGDMVQGTGALGIDDTKGAHTGVGCIECHMTESNHLFKLVEPEDVIGTDRTDTCTACHTDSSAESRAIYRELWSESIQGKLAIIDADVTAIDAALEANPNALTAEQVESYKNWRANFWYVRKDKSNGAHNFEYAIKILSQTQKEIKALKAALK